MNIKYKSYTCLYSAVREYLIIFYSSHMWRVRQLSKVYTSREQKEGKKKLLWPSFSIYSRQSSVWTRTGDAHEREEQNWRDGEGNRGGIRKIVGGLTLIFTCLSKQINQNKYIWVKSLNDFLLLWINQTDEWCTRYYIRKSK